MLIPRDVCGCICCVSHQSFSQNSFQEMYFYSYCAFHRHVNREWTFIFLRHHAPLVEKGCVLSQYTSVTLIDLSGQLDRGLLVSRQIT
jgi:hypothetical protein